MKPKSADRFSVSMPHRLLKDLDVMAAEKGYDNRSLLIADMVRDWLVEHRQQYGDEATVARRIRFGHTATLLTDVGVDIIKQGAARPPHRHGRLLTVDAVGAEGKNSADEKARHRYGMNLR